jgi:hypothetical protein
MEKIKELLIDIYTEALSLGINLEDIDFWVLKVKSEAREVAEEFQKVKQNREDSNGW